MFLFQTSTITRWTDETAEDPEAQLLGRINESLWHVIDVDKSTGVDNKATKLVFMQYFQEGVHNKVMCTFVASQHHNCRTIPVIGYLSGNWIGHFVSVCARMEWLPWLDDCLASLIRSKRSPLTVSLHMVSSIEKRWLAEKYHLNLTFCRMWLK